MTNSTIFNSLDNFEIESAIVMIDGTEMYYDDRYKEIKSAFQAGEISKEEFCGRTQAIFLEVFPGHVQQEKTVLELVREGEIKKALDVLENNYPDALLLKARYNQGEKKFNLGLIDADEWQSIKNTIGVWCLGKILK